MQYRNIDKQALKTNGYTVLSKITIVGTDTVFTEDDYIVDWDYEDYRFVPNNGFIGQFVERIFDGNLQNISDGVILEDTEINLQLGIKNNLDLDTQHNPVITWYDYGNFLVTKVEKTDTTGNYKFESADYTKKFNKVFDGDYTDTTYTKSFNDKIEDGETVTALWLAQYACKQAGVVLNDTNFTNYDFVISSNQYDSEDTLRKVMQDIGKLAYSWVRVGEDNKVHIDFTPKATSSVDQYDQLTTDEYYVSKKSDLAFGPVNKVLIGMSDVEGENLYVTSQDYTPETECAIKIYDNNLTNTEELRQTALNGASRLFGLTYTPMEINSVGHPWLDGDELIKLTNVDSEIIYTYPFNRKIHYAGYIEGVIGAEASTSQNSEYEYKSDIISNVKRTSIIVDKQEQTITALAEDVSDNTSDISQLQIDLNGIDLRVQSVETTEVTGVTNEYAVNDSATTPPAQSSSSWSTTKPTRGEGQYIWARIKTTYKSGNIAYSDPVNTTGDKGDDGGDGKGITSINVYYKTTSTQDEPSAASITSTTIPEMDATTNKYLWQKQVTNYNDSTSTTTVTLIGVYGDKGEDADPAIMYHNAKGIAIYTEDAGNLELKSINYLNGDTYQETTEVGKNICPSDFSYWESGHYAVSDGSKEAQTTRVRTIALVPVKPSTTYYINTFSDSDNFVIRTFSNSKSFNRSLGGISNGATITTTTSEYYLGVAIYSQVYNSRSYSTYETMFTNGDIKPFICLNSETDKSFEPYIPNSPSPDYPQDIHTVTGDNVVNICGKNLASSYWVDSRTDRYITALRIEADLKPNTTYTISFNGISGNKYYPNENLFTTSVAFILTSERKTITLTTKNDISRNYANQYSSTGGWAIFKNEIAQPNNSEFNNVQLEQGSSATTYEPYKGNTYEVNLGKNLFEPVMPTRTYQGLDVIKNDDGSYTINGTATANTTFRLDQPNQGFGNPKYYDGTYTLSIKTNGSILLNVIIMNFDTYNALMSTNGTQTKNITSGSTGSFIYLSIPSGTTINNQTYYVQLEKGSSATDYAPYFEPIELCEISNYKDYIKRSSNKNMFNKHAQPYLINNYITSNGSFSSTDEFSIYKIEVKPNTTYTLTNTGGSYAPGLCYYDNNDTFINGFNYNNQPTITFTTPTNTSYILMSAVTLTTSQRYDLDIMQLEEGSSATSYEPFAGTWSIYKNIGKITLNGSESDWVYDSTYNYFRTSTYNFNTLIPKTAYSGMLQYSDYFKLITPWNTFRDSTTTNGFYWLQNSGYKLAFRNTAYTVVNDFKSWLSNTQPKIYYILATEKVMEITNQDLINQLDALEKAKLNEGINNIMVVGHLPVILDLDYWTYYKGETGRSIESITEEYALSTSSSSITGTWSSDVPTMTSTNKYLWNRETITYANPTSSETGEPKIIGVYGLQGEDGKGIQSVTELYYVSNSSTAPAKPSSHVTRSDLITYNQWNLQCPPYTTTYKYFYTCSEILYTDNTYGWTNVTQNQGLAIANANANNALNTINNLSIGGRNLLYYSDFKDTSYAPYYGVRNNYGTYTLINNGLKSGTNSIKVTLNFATGSSGTDMTMNLTIGNTLPNKEYSFSGWAKASENMTLYARLGYGANTLSTPIGTTWQRFKIEGIKSGSQVHNQLLPYCIATNSGASIQFACLKFEEGNKATDWTPAPEDTDATISALNTYVDNNVQNLQNQIDGAIQFWNGANIPTLSNYPASGWTTEAERINHQADIYTVIQDVSGELKQGKSYRFDKVSGTWQWIELTDNELSAVQALASSKAKVYVTTPTVPYNIGDLWLNNNKLYRCKTAKDNSGSYAAADWELATDYTNDDTANTAIGLVNNLSIGGRNLITESTYTAAPSSNANWAAGTGNTISVSYTNGGRTGKVTNGNFGEIQLFTTLEQINCKATDNITFSCDVKLLPLDNETEPDVSNYVYLGYSLYYDGTSHSPNWYTGAQLKWDSTTKGAKYGEWTRLHIVFPGYTGTYNYQKLMFGVIAYANQANSDIKFVIRNCKIERGNKPTDWTLAPEDISEEINDVNSNFSNYVTTEAYDSDWQTRKDEILGTVKATYTTESDFGTYKQEMSTALSMKADSATIVATASDVVSNAISGIEDTVNDINETFTFDTNGLTIARGSNTMYLQLQNNRLSFKTDETEAGERAYMTSNAFVLKELTQFQIGNFKFEVRTNGSLDFKKV